MLQIRPISLVFILLLSQLLIHFVQASLVDLSGKSTDSKLEEDNNWPYKQNIVLTEEEKSFGVKIDEHGMPYINCMTSRNMNTPSGLIILEKLEKSGAKNKMNGSLVTPSMAKMIIHGKEETVEKCYGPTSSKHAKRIIPACITVFNTQHAQAGDLQQNQMTEVPEKYVIYRGCWGLFDDIQGECSDAEHSVKGITYGPEICAVPMQLNNRNSKESQKISDPDLDLPALAVDTNETTGAFWAMMLKSMQYCCCRGNQCNHKAYILPPGPESEEGATRIAAVDAQDNHFDQSQNEFILWLIPKLLTGIFFTLLILIPLCMYKNIINCVKGLQMKNKIRIARADNTKEKLLDDLIEVVVPVDLDITNFELISRGRFGEVYKGEWNRTSGSIQVAVKSHFAHDKASLESYKTEKEVYELLVKAPKQTNMYEGVLPFLCCDNRSDRLWIITEYMPNKSLYEHLVEHQYTLPRSLKLCTDILGAVSYLHHEIYDNGRVVKPLIVHRDIKSKNIFLKDDLSACIGDFGLACKYEKGQTNRKEFPLVGTRRYMAPEVLEAATEFTSSAFKQIDVYATALVLWEVISRTQCDEDEICPEYKMPFQDEVGLTPTLSDMRLSVIARKERPCFRMEILMTEGLNEMSNVVAEMWETEADARITARNALEKYKAIARRQKLSLDNFKGGSGARKWVAPPPEDAASTPGVSRRATMNSMNSAAAEGGSSTSRAVQPVQETQQFAQTTSPVQQATQHLKLPGVSQAAVSVAQNTRPPVLPVPSRNPEEDTVWREVIPEWLNKNEVLHELPGGPFPTSIAPISRREIEDPVEVRITPRSVLYKEVITDVNIVHEDLFQDLQEMADIVGIGRQYPSNVMQKQTSSNKPLVNGIMRTNTNNGAKQQQNGSLSNGHVTMDNSSPSEPIEVEQKIEQVEPEAEPSSYKPAVVTETMNEEEQPKAVHQLNGIHAKTREKENGHIEQQAAQDDEIDQTDRPLLNRSGTQTLSSNKNKKNKKKHKHPTTIEMVQM